MLAIATRRFYEWQDLSWYIERDREGKPLRMHWAPGADEYLNQQNRELEAAKKRACLPMPAMRDWAIQRGLNNG